ncbi:hypothetical protein QBC39DRAFT_410437 [Podospora conica]|nr:hypothetical protein QBC39DRAFT_410437 [Schizothecium conicum]
MTTSDQINGDFANGHAQNGNIYTVLSQNGDGPSQPAVNGDGTSWAFVNHILNYPVVNDSVASFKSTPLGQRSLELGDSAYRTFAVPVLPYFSWPLQLITPYAKKADDLGDKTLSRVDEKFPIVKKPTDELINDARSIASIPLRVGQTGKDHVLSTYGAELDKTGGNGLLGRGKAAVTTALILTSESLSSVSSYLNEKKKQSSEVVEEKTASS